MIILVDTREKRNEHITQQFDVLKVPYIRQKLDFGDYSFELIGESYAEKIVIERKANLDELASNLTKERDRFRREFERCKSKKCKLYLTIEDASWKKIADGDYRSKFSPSAFQNSLSTWAYKFEFVLDFIKKQDMAIYILETFFKYLEEEKIMNNVILMGRLTKDFDLKSSNSGAAFGSFSIAINRQFSKSDEKQADFINCKAFGKTAEFISKYFKKGSMIAIEGRIQSGSYEKDGSKVYTTDIIVEKVHFTGEAIQKADTQKGMIGIDDGVADLPF